MKALIEIKLNLPHSNKLLFEVEIRKTKTGYEVWMTDIETWEDIHKPIIGKGKNIDEAIEELLKKMDFYNKPGV